MRTGKAIKVTLADEPHQRMDAPESSFEQRLGLALRLLLRRFGLRNVGLEAANPGPVPSPAEEPKDDRD